MAGPVAYWTPGANYPQPDEILSCKVQQSALPVRVTRRRAGSVRTQRMQAFKETFHG